MRRVAPSPAEPAAAGPAVPVTEQERDRRRRTVGHGHVSRPSAFKSACHVGGSLSCRERPRGTKAVTSSGRSAGAGTLFVEQHVQSPSGRRPRFVVGAPRGECGRGREGVSPSFQENQACSNRTRYEIGSPSPSGRRRRGGFWPGDRRQGLERAVAQPRKEMVACDGSVSPRRTASPSSREPARRPTKARPARAGANPRLTENTETVRNSQGPPSRHACRSSRRS
jgi:hypothetical protein